jgi:hypothetical protein
MATARHSPVGFVDIAGNGLDAFDTEIVAPPPENVATPPVAAGPPMLEIVAAYPETEACPDAWRSTARRRLTLRRIGLGTFKLARTVALFPLVVLSWILLRIWWVLRLSVTSAWRLVTGTVWLVGSVLAAIGRGVRDAINGVLAAFAYGGGLVATAATAAARGTRHAVVGAGRATAGSVSTVARGARRLLLAARRTAIHGFNTAGARIAGAGAALSRGTRDAATGTARALRAAGVALTMAMRRLVSGASRDVARATAAAAMVGHTTLANGAAVTRLAGAAAGRGTRRAALDTSHAVDAAGAALAKAARLLASRIGGSVARSTTAAAMNGRAALAATLTARRAATRIGLATRGAMGASVLAGMRVARSSAAALKRAERPKVRMAVAGMPVWARQMRLVPALGIALAAAAVVSVGITTLLLSLRQTAQIEAPPATGPAQEAAPQSVVLAVAPAPVNQATVPVRPAVARRATQRRPARIAAAVRTPAVVPALAARGVTAAPERGGLSAARVRDLWSRTDTRSLDRGLAALRSATLAFQRCEMRRTSNDTAVAHCDEVPAPVAWTIDFRRDDGRWLIEGLASERRVAR